MADQRLQMMQNLAREVRGIQQSQQQMVDHINAWVAKIQSIDTVAFAALALHDGKKFTLDKKKVETAQKGIKAVIDEMGRYRDEAIADAKKKEEAEAKKAPIIKQGKNRGNKILTQ